MKFHCFILCEDGNYLYETVDSNIFLKRFADDFHSFSRTDHNVSLKEDINFANSILNNKDNIN